MTVKARLGEIGHMVLGLGVLNPMYSHNKLVSCPIHPPEPGISADSNPKPSESSKVDFTQNRDCSALIGRNWPHGLSSRRISDLLGWLGNGFPASRVFYVGLFMQNSTLSETPLRFWLTFPEQNSPVEKSLICLVTFGFGHPERTNPSLVITLSRQDAQNQVPKSLSKCPRQNACVQVQI